MLASMLHPVWLYTVLVHTTMLKFTLRSLASKVRRKRSYWLDRSRLSGAVEPY